MIYGDLFSLSLVKVTAYLVHFFQSFSICSYVCTVLSRYGKVNTSTVTMWALSSCEEVQLAWYFRYGKSLAYNE